MGDWCSEDVLQLIKLYEQQPILWDKSLKSVGNIQKRKMLAWNNIALEMKLRVRDIQRKMRHILNLFEMEKRHGKATINNQSVQSEVYLTKWFAFPHLSFLLKEAQQNNENVCLENNRSSHAVCIENEALNEVESYQTNPCLQQVNDVFTDKNKKKRKKAMRKSGDTQQNDDDCSVFANHIAHKLRHYDLRTRNIVEFHINEILFRADMGDFNSVPSNDQEQISIPIQTDENGSIELSQ